jgi:GT2 family glycosyltransferase
VRREWVDRLGGWDERFGAGTAAFPACEDMDFNWRFLRAGGVGLRTPRVRSSHDQWRNGAELIALQGSYARAWGGWLAKLARTGGGRAAWRFGRAYAADTGWMALSALRRRSRLRARIAATRTRGLVGGLACGMRARW